MAKKNLNRGLFITFEGPEGCGKSTQSRMFYDYLCAQGYKCIYTREPGGTRLGEKIRQVLLHSGDITISALAELFLFEAARAQIAREVISPGLEKGKIVICDRFGDATVAYQGYAGKAASIETIKKLNMTAAAGLKPDLTILLDVDTITGLRRARKKGIDRMEAKDTAYHKRVRMGYLDLAKREPGRIKVVKAEADLNKTQENIRKLIEGLLCHLTTSKATIV